MTPVVLQSSATSGLIALLIVTAVAGAIIGTVVYRAGKRWPRTGRLVLVLAAALAVLSCSPSPTTGLVPVNGRLDQEGNSVQSWCAQTSRGFRIFYVGVGDEQNMAVAADPACAR